MSVGKMHDDEIEIDALLVRRLLAAQFPRWKELSIRRVKSAGTDNALYRLGDEMVVRLPRIPSAIDQVHKEHAWLPKLAPYLPLEIPIPLAKGEPSDGYPWNWSIYRWLEGENATIEKISNHPQAAIDLAQFITALQHIDTTGAPACGSHDFSRGKPLALRDQYTRAAIATLRGTHDVAAITRVWDAALKAPVWNGTPVWLHGDLQSGNLLAVQGRLNAVIDFGCLGVGDPASDVMAAWLYLSIETRKTFRETLQVDDATWARARGWALSVGLIILPYYQKTNRVLYQIGRRAVDETLADFCEKG